MSDAASRLSRLRLLLREESVDGFLLPRSDEYLGEYVPPSAERLAWLTGFSGSAGFAIILPENACIFSDGRYQLQMQSEVDVSVWSLAHMHETPGPAWLEQHGMGMAIGYDPRTISQSELASYSEAGCRMVAMAQHPIDALWHDRPAPPHTTVETLDAALTGSDSRTRIRIVTDTLQRDGQDAVILPDPTAIAWMLNIRARDLPFLPVALCFAIVLASGRVRLFIDTDRLPDDVLTDLGPDVTVLSPDALDTAIGTLAGLSVRLDPLRSSAWFWQRVRATGGTPVAGTDPCLEPRARKTSAEREGMRQAHLWDGVALCRFLFWLDNHGIGRTEVAVAEHLLTLRREEPNCVGASFSSISATGANAAIMHYNPRLETCATLEAGQFFLIDSGGQYRQGTTDVTRTIWMGEGCPPPEWRDQYTRVLKGLIALTCAVFPDRTPGYRLDPLARHALWQVGLDFDHGAGHGLGNFLSVHEWPLGFTRRPVLDPIEEHMVLTNEPGYYAEGSHGIRLENAMVVRRSTPEGNFLCFDTLTLAPIDRRGIEPALLTAHERAWLNSFHARVAEAIGPYLDSDEKAWLLEACAPL